MPSTAIPSTLPTWPNAISIAEPAPARSRDTAPSAITIAVGSPKPRPRPKTAVHMATNPYPVSAPVIVPITAPAASSTNPASSAGLAPSLGTSRLETWKPTMSPPSIGSIRSPVPNASAPSTACSNCGRTNSTPNRTSEITVANAAPVVYAREENNDTSSNGAGECRSHQTNAASNPIPAISVPSTRGLAHPDSGPWISPYVREIRPRLEARMPA